MDNTTSLIWLVEFAGAAFGVFCGFWVERWREERRFESRINDISPIIVRELKDNLEIIKIWEKRREDFWRYRPLFKNFSLEVFKQDLWRWSVKNKGNFPEMYTTIQELNSYLLRYGDNPVFDIKYDKLIPKLKKIILKQPELFQVESDLNLN